jgi:hypothetical protein
MEHAGRPQSGVTVNLEVNMKTAFGFLFAVVMFLPSLLTRQHISYDKKPISKEQLIIFTKIQRQGISAVTAMYSSCL